MPSFKLSQFCWELKMAWRDSRASVPKLLLFASAMIVGILVIVLTLHLSRASSNLLRAYGASLLGAELSIRSQSGFVPVDAVKRHASRVAQEISFRTMAAFIRGDKVQNARLVMVRALDPEIPLEGSVQTTPNNVWRELHFTDGNVLIDESLQLSFGATVGDSLEIAGRRWRIIGVVNSVAGEFGAAYNFLPKVYMARDELSSQYLAQRGTRAFYLTYASGLSESPAKVETLLEQTPGFSEARIRTIEDRQRYLGELSDSVSSFLQLLGFSALLLGALGGGSGLSVYLRKKRESYGILRCLGLAAGPLRRMVLYTVAITAIAASLLGAVAGYSAFYFAAVLFSQQFEYQVNLSPQLDLISFGVAVGFAALVVVVLPTLHSVCSVSPLQVLRGGQQDGLSRSYRKVMALPFVLLILLLGLLLPKWSSNAAYFAAGCLVLVSVLAIVSALFRAGLRRFLPRWLPFPLRHGAASLYRPQNSTILVCTGFASVLAVTVAIATVQDAVQSLVNKARSQNVATFYAFDISSDEKPEVRQLLKEEGLEIVQDSPVVVMRIASINGKAAEQLAQMPELRAGRRMLRREYWSSYREDLLANERITQGEWIPKHNPEDGAVPVSVAEHVAERLKLKLGDSLEFDVQGRLVPAVVTSLRDIRWESMERNSLLLFPAGALEAAPQFHFITSKPPNKPAVAEATKRLALEFPDVSVVDISSVSARINEVLESMATVVRWLGILFFLGATSVLAVSIVSSHAERTRELSLLRTIGATRAIVYGCVRSEYLVLLGVAGITGIIGGCIAGSALTLQVLRSSIFLPWGAVLAIGVFFLLFGLAVASLSARQTMKVSPLEALRND